MKDKDVEKAIDDIMESVDFVENMEDEVFIRSQGDFLMRRAHIDAIILLASVIQGRAWPV